MTELDEKSGTVSDKVMYLKLSAAFDRIRNKTMLENINGILEEREGVFVLVFVGAAHAVPLQEALVLEGKYDVTLTTAQIPDDAKSFLTLENLAASGKITDAETLNKAMEFLRTAPRNIQKSKN